MKKLERLVVTWWVVMWMLFFKIRLHLAMFYEGKLAKNHETLSFLSPFGVLVFVYWFPTLNLQSMALSFKIIHHMKKNCRQFAQIAADNTV